MSETTSKFDQFGFDADPFSTTIADEEVASRYKLVGRDEQEYQLHEFVREGIENPTPMKRRMIFGEYGTGKSHHLVHLRDDIRDGVDIEGSEYDAIGVYVGNLGLSIKRLYEKIVEEILDNAPELQNAADALPSVEPEDSVDEAYQYERLQDNITKNLRKLANAAREDHNYRAIYIFIDEAEDIANEDEDIVQPFIRAFLHLVNNLNAAGIHILLGFSQGARMRITSYEDDEDTLGNALVQRFQGGEIYLGDLTEADVKEMLIDRMDQHRSTNRGELTPIVESTVSVVTEVTGGHPREILRLYSEALKHATKVDLDRIDGDAIVSALTGFNSFTRDEELLDQRAITDLKQALEDAHPDAREDFEELQGRLIGEADEVPERAFSEGVPGALLSPITVDGEDRQELRVLEQRESHGRYSYVLSEDARDFLFGSTGEGGTKIQKLDLQAQSAPEKFQRELSRGLGIALQEAGHGSLHKNPVTQARDRYEFGLHLITVKRDAGKSNQTVALGIYNGQEVPQELVQLYVETIQDQQASFGVLVKQNQQFSADAHKYLNDLDPVQQEAFNDRVIQLDVTTEQRDEFIYGRLLALGNTETDADEDVDTDKLVGELGVIPALDDQFDDLLLPYPDKIYREVVDYLRGESTKSFTIGDLRDALDLKQYDLNADIMQGLQAQALVAKDGQRWTYPDLESDRPPWYELYKLLNEDGPLTVEELQARLAQEYAFDCAAGDENAMFQWYLDHLQIQDYVEPRSIEQDGKTVDAFDVVDISDQFSKTRKRAERRWDEAEELVDQALDLNVGNATQYQNRLDDLETELETFETVFEPDHSDLDAAKAVVDDITGLEEEVEEALQERRETIVGEAENLHEFKIEQQIERIDDADVEGSLATQLSDYRSDLSQYRAELKELIDNEQYQRLQKRTDVIEESVADIEAEIDDILEKKQQCLKAYKEVTGLRDDAEEAIEAISTENSVRAELEDELGTLDGHLQDYQDRFNAGDFDDALEIIEDTAKPQAKTIEREARQVKNQEKQYREQLDDLDPEITEIDDEDQRSAAQDYLDNARQELQQGNFAEVPVLIDEVEDLLSGPTREEQFTAALQEADGSIADMVADTDFDTAEAFKFLRRKYEAGDVTDVHAVRDDE
jgi:hypothetical protein